MGKRVTYARFHTVLHIPNFGQLPDVMPPVGKTLLDLKMETSEGGLEISATPPKSRIPVSFVVPWANVQLAVYAAEVAEKPKASG